MVYKLKPLELSFDIEDRSYAASIGSVMLIVSGARHFACYTGPVKGGVKTYQRGGAKLYH